MSRTVSPSSNKPYGVARVVAIWCLARSSFYAARHRQQHPREPHKRGPRVLSDENLAGCGKMRVSKWNFLSGGADAGRWA